MELLPCWPSTLHLQISPADTPYHKKKSQKKNRDAPLIKEKIARRSLEANPSHTKGLFGTASPAASSAASHEAVPNGYFWN